MARVYFAHELHQALLWKSCASLQKDFQHTNKWILMLRPFTTTSLSRCSFHSKSDGKLEKKEVWFKRTSSSPTTGWCDRQKEEPFRIKLAQMKINGSALAFKTWPPILSLWGFTNRHFSNHRHHTACLHSVCLTNRRILSAFSKW